MESRVRVSAKWRRSRGLRPRRHSRQISADNSSDDESGSDTWYHQHEVNNRKVDNITIQFFYKPRTLTLLFICLVAMLSFAFARSDAPDITT